MTYALLSAGFLVGSAVAAAVLLAIARARPRILAVVITIAALVALTAVFDTVMIGAGFFSYADAHLAGPRIGLAPIEDFAYPVAGAILLPALWLALRARSRREADE